MNDKKKRWGWAIAGLIWMAVIFWFSAQPAEQSEGMSGGVVEMIREIFLGIIPASTFDFVSNFSLLDFFVRKSAHFMEYAVLGGIAFGFFGTWKTIQSKIWKRMGVGTGWVFFYACTDELHQLFVPGRSGQWTDVCLDTLGGFVGIVLVVIILKICYTRNAAKENNISVKS